MCSFRVNCKPNADCFYVVYSVTSSIVLLTAETVEDATVWLSFKLLFYIEQAQMKGFSDGAFLN